MELDTFHDGDVIYPGPINENFQALKERELGSLGDVDVSGAGEGQVLKYNGTSWEMGTDNTGGLGVWTESGNDIYWNGAGNVGIGTTDPTSKLQVTGLPIHADNAAAIGAGLTAGAFYHNGDGIVRVVY